MIIIIFHTLRPAQMAVIEEMKFSNAFSWKEILNTWVKFLWNVIVKGSFGR